MARILIVEDLAQDANCIKKALAGHEFDEAGDVNTALQMLKDTHHKPYRLIILDLKIWKSNHPRPGISEAPDTPKNRTRGLEVLREILNSDYRGACTILSGFTFDDTVKKEFAKLLRPYHHQIDLLPKEHILDNPQEFRSALWRALTEITDEDRRELEEHGIFGESDVFLDCLRQAKTLAEDDGPVLITGPSGAGKTGFAEAIYIFRRREGAPFVEKNMAELLAIGESGDARAVELFGCMPNTYSGYPGGYMGIFERASGYGERIDRSKKESLSDQKAGVAFIDEIHHLSISLQAALLRVVQERTIQRVGSSKDTPANRLINCKIVFGTRVDIWKLADESEPKFLPDLLSRIGGEYGHIHLPGLRDRSDDIFPILLGLITKELENRGINKDVKIHQFVRDYLSEYVDLPRNVRDLCDVARKVVSEQACQSADKRAAIWVTVRHITDIFPRQQEISTARELWRAIQNGQYEGCLKDIKKLIGDAGFAELSKVVMHTINPAGASKSKRRWPTQAEIDNWFPGVSYENWKKSAVESVSTVLKRKVTHPQAKDFLCED